MMAERERGWPSGCEPLVGFERISNGELWRRVRLRQLALRAAGIGEDVDLTAPPVAEESA